MKIKEKKKACLLRKKGQSIKEIAKNIGVSVSSVSRWVRDIKLTLKQEEVLKNRNPIYNRQKTGWVIWSHKCRKNREEWQASGRELAKKKDPFFLAGCALYWGEGDKSKNVAGISNTDINLLRYFLSFLRRFYDVTDDMIGLRVQCYFKKESFRDKIIEYWCDELDLPRSCFKGMLVNPHNKYSKKRKTIHTFGTCSLKVCRTYIVQSIYGAIQEMGEFNKPEWIDKN